MRARVISVTDRVQRRFGDNGVRLYLDAFKLDCVLRNLSPKTIDIYFERLGYLFTYLQQARLGFESVDRRLVQNYALSLQGEVSDETVNGRIRAYKRFFNFLVSEGLWERENPMNGMKPLRTAKKVKPVVDPDTVQRIVGSLNRKSFVSNRNLIMILVLWDGMLRRNELLGLKLADIDFQSRLVKVFGKGRKERMVPLGAKSLKALHKYVVKWRSKYPGEHLICMRNGEPLTERRCRKIVQAIGREHGVQLYPHLLRHLVHSAGRQSSSSAENTGTHKSARDAGLPAPVQR